MTTVRRHVMSLALFSKELLRGVALVSLCPGFRIAKVPWKPLGWASCLGFRMQDLEFRVYGLGFRV